MLEASISTFTNYPIENLTIEKVSRCIVTRSQLVLTPFGVHKASLFANLPPKFRRRMHFVGFGSALKNKLRRLPDQDDIYFVMNVWSLGHHHWLAEVAIKFILFEEQLRAGRILMPENPPRFIREFLELFDFKNIEYTTANVYVPRLNVITNPNSGHFSANHLIMFKKAVVSRIGVKSGKPFRKIYVTRANARARKVLNDTDVAASLKRRGFEIVDLDNASFEYQVRLFSETKIFVSLHGSALTNAIFMPTGGTVVELYPEIDDPETQLNACYYRMCGVLDLHHRFLFSSRPKNSAPTRFRYDDIAVDLGKLDLILDEVVNDKE